MNRILPAVTALAISAVAWAVTAPKTINNLEAAIQAEANASHKYELFSKKAQSEGYPQVAKLFRAASEAEAIHRQNHQMALLALGGPTVKITLQPVTIRSTRDNLKGPIQGEARERAVLYPKLIKEAQDEHATEAVRSFTYARDTEAEHEKLFIRALSQLGHNPPEDYYVSKYSGDTVAVPQGQSFAKAQGGGYTRVG